VARRPGADPSPDHRQPSRHRASNIPAIVQALATRLGDMNPADPTSVPATIQQMLK
jgi:hypothetical protein